MSSTSLTEDGALCVKLHPAFKVVLGRAVLADADVIGSDALNAAILVEQNFRRGETCRRYFLKLRHRFCEIVLALLLCKVAGGKGISETNLKP